MIRQDLYLSSPWMNAAGMLGFAPPARWPVTEPMGAFVTNPLSLGPRTPAAERGLRTYPGGALLHSGLPNPGLSRVIRRYAARWQRSSLPVWVHLIGSSPDEIHQMVQRLEGRDGILAIELGLPPKSRGNEALAFTEAAFGEIPLVVHLPITMAGEPWLNDLPRLGASAVSLGAPRGTLPGSNNGPRLNNGLLNGRMVGPALFPMVMAAVQSTRRLSLKVIAGAGIYRRQDAAALLNAGAWAVQLDTVLWRGWIE